MMDTSSNSEPDGAAADGSGGGAGMRHHLIAARAEAQATHILIGALLAHLRLRRAVTADFAATIRTLEAGATGRLGDVYDAAFRDAIAIMLSQIEPAGGDKPRHPKPKLSLVTEN